MRTVARLALALGVLAVIASSANTLIRASSVTYECCAAEGVCAGLDVCCPPGQGESPCSPTDPWRCRPDETICGIPPGGGLH